MKQAALFLSETYKLNRITPALGFLHFILLASGQINLQNWKYPAAFHTPIFSVLYIYIHTVYLCADIYCS